jgi:DNA-directed RNA polymerase subunit RPC12/RpoP
MNFNNRLRNFMMGRYGVDQLNKFLISLGFIIIIISAFFPNIITYNLSLILIIICYFRMLSRNHAKRYKENNIYLNYKNRFFNIFKKQKYNSEQRKTYHIYKCPTCSQKIRIPKGKGKICITCPKCHAEFIRKS